MKINKLFLSLILIGASAGTVVGMEEQQERNMEEQQERNDDFGFVVKSRPVKTQIIGTDGTIRTVMRSNKEEKYEPSVIYSARGIKTLAWNKFEKNKAYYHLGIKQSIIGNNDLVIECADKKKNDK